MTATAQSYANHRRVFPLYHLFALPILIAHVAVTTVVSVRHPSLWNLWLVVVALGLVGGVVANRASTIIVQNRLIGLEMRLRLATVLPVELCQRIPELHLSSSSDCATPATASSSASSSAVCAASSRRPTQ